MVEDCLQVVGSGDLLGVAQTETGSNTGAYLNRIATAVPDHDVHEAFVVFAENMLGEPQLRSVFRRMVSRAKIKHRFSFLDPRHDAPPEFSSHDAQKFYRPGNFPGTRRRMEVFEQSAPFLMK